MKTTILLKKNGFQSQIEFVLKSIVRLNFFNLGAFGFPSCENTDALPNAPGSKVAIRGHIYFTNLGFPEIAGDFPYYSYLNRHLGFLVV